MNYGKGEEKMTTENTMNMLNMPRINEPTTTKHCLFVADSSFANYYYQANVERLSATKSQAWNEYLARKASAPRCLYAPTAEKPIRLSGN